MRDNTSVMLRKQFEHIALFFLIISYFLLKGHDKFSLYFCENFNILKNL